MSEDLSLSDQDLIILPQKQEKFKRMFLVMVVVLLVVVGLVFAGIINNKTTSPDWLLQRNVPTAVPKPTGLIQTPTPAGTANWKTYTNGKYGFEFKYPADINVCDYQNTIYLEYGFKSLCQVMESRKITLFTQEELDSAIKDFKDRINNKFTEAELSIEYEGDRSKINFFNEIISDDKTKIFAWFKLSKGYYYIEISGKDKDITTLFAQILSTFKFIPSNKNCIAEGGKGNYTNDLRCCQSLVETDCYPSSDPPCAAMESTCFSCIKCGDGKCGNGETKCNCPSDCF